MLKFIAHNSASIVTLVASLGLIIMVISEVNHTGMQLLLSGLAVSVFVISTTLEMHKKAKQAKARTQKILDQVKAK